MSAAVKCSRIAASRRSCSTYGEKVVDVFYVKDLFGHKIEQSARLKDIRTRLTAALESGAKDAGKRARKTVAAE